MNRVVNHAIKAQSIMRVTKMKEKKMITQIHTLHYIIHHTHKPILARIERGIPIKEINMQRKNGQN